MKSKPKRPQQNRRTKVLIDVSTQRALALRMVLHCLSFLVLGGLLAAAQQYFSHPFQTLPEFLSLLWGTLSPYVVAFLALLPLLVFDSLRLSNRVVGPICRLRAVVKQAARGEDPPPLTFRKRDYWQDLPGEFNAMVEGLRHANEHSVEPEVTLNAN